MSRLEEVELTNMCMICDGKGNVLVQDKKNHPTWHGWNFPGGHVEKGEFVTPSVIREIKEETGLVIENPTNVLVINIFSISLCNSSTEKISATNTIPKISSVAFSITLIFPLTE